MDQTMKVEELIPSGNQGLRLRAQKIYINS
jgi:hypothetical protein